jgi:hypothetical protein
MDINAMAFSDTLSCWFLDLLFTLDANVYLFDLFKRHKKFFHMGLFRF